MPRNVPPLTWFRSFEAAARTLSFTAAAGEIGLTQSAVSQQVKSLEMRLGVPLFVRKTRSLALTDDGRKLLPQVAAALGALASATEPYDRGTDENVLTVATSVSVAQWCLSPRLREFAQHHPAVHIRLLSAVWPDDFHASHADVEIRFGPLAQAGKGTTALLPNRLIAVCAPSLRGMAANWPLIETVGTSTGWAAWQKTHGPCGAPTLFADTYGLALQLAADGNGVALVSELLALNAIKSGALIRAHAGSIAASEGYYLSRKAQTDSAAAFADWVLEIVSGR